MNTEKERNLYMPQDVFYQQLAEKMVECGVTVDMFLFPQAFIDIATVGTLVICSNVKDCCQV